VAVIDNKVEIMSKFSCRVDIGVLLMACFGLTISCIGQVMPPEPGLLTSTRTFQGMTFHYPNNWIVRDKVGSLTVGPESAFIQRIDGRDFVTYGFFLWVNQNSSSSLHELTSRALLSLQQKYPSIMVDLSTLRDSGNPPWESCGSTLDTSPPYAGTETGLVCTYRLGALVVEMMAFSPTKDWAQYHSIFDKVIISFSSESIPNAKVKASPVTPYSITRHSANVACESGHWIESIGGDGKIIKLEDGSMWEVDDVDTVDTAIWLPISNVVVCDTKMINIDDNESAEVTRITTSNASLGALKRQSYVIDAAANDETFVINGNVFKAKTYCFNVEKGDKVIFVDGSALGACSSAKFLDLRNDKVCSVWCE